MSIPGSANPLLLRSAAAAGGYAISRSLRFNSADSAYLSRTPASAGNRKTWTWAGWVKRSSTDSDGAVIFSSSPSAGANTYICFAGSNTTATTADGISFFSAPLSVNVGTAGVFRDFSAWFHLVVAVDTTQGTAANRVKIYINGTEATYASTSYPTSSQDLGINAAFSHTIGTTNNLDSYAYFNGYLADVYFIDGQALTPSSFTETDATTGQLVEKAYTGSYGTNGFHLEFADNSSNTATTLGKDTSGNGNNWTPNNLSVTAGAGNDSLVDVPTNGAQTDTGVGGEVRGNYCTWNPLDTFGPTFANGNLDASYNTTSWKGYRSTFAPTSGKWYWEVTVNTLSGSNYTNIGVSKAIGAGGVAINSDFDNTAETAGYNSTGAKVSSTYGGGTYGASFTAGDVIGVGLDVDAGTLVFYKNGTSQGTAYSNLTANAAWTPAMSMYGNVAISVNFGQRAFAYQTAGTNRPASTYKALCTANLPAPLVTKPSTVMDVVLYTGTGSSLTLPYASSTPTSIAFTPDLVWIKGRSGATDHALYDAVRDVQKDLVSNSTAAETTQSTGLTAFGTNTFTIGSLAKLNTSSATYAAWCWDAGTTTDTNNTAGSITSQVRANVSAGFSVVTYTGSGTTSTIGHGLGVAPQLIITKNRSSGSFNWGVYHAAAGNSVYGKLNLADAFSSLPIWQNTTPSSTVFYVGNYNAANQSADNYVAYCFAPVAGYNSISSYTGNGSSDGVFVFTGMRPRWIMIKRTDTTSNWTIIDTAREGYNVDNDPLYPNLANAEGTTDLADILSNGFKLRSTDASVNASGGTYVYAAFAEAPLNYSRAR